MANLNSDISEGDNVDDYDLKLNLTTSKKVHLQQFKKKNRRLETNGAYQGKILPPYITNLSLIAKITLNLQFRLCCTALCLKVYESTLM